MKKRHLTLLILALAIMLNACDSTKGETERISKTIAGDWNVQWVTYPDQNASQTEGINYTMNGLMNIKEDGKITISAYGYDGCIFGSDTLIHTLNWEVVSDTVLNLINDGDKYGIPYTIKEISDDKIKLQLVEDVFLFLTK
ncbi:MAG: hypothetical protein ABJF11_08315 [Reichenbachiella sp.]|uniref:hypothetical protein n=1 Tax=Reichenbachiella sp. TaxID=2184521 RepID=UPI003265F03C